MTVIACNETMMAADHLLQSSSGIIYQRDKIVRIGSSLWGASGALGDTDRFLAWVRSGMEGDPPTTTTRDGIEGGGCVELKKNGEIWEHYLCGARCRIMPYSYWAIGSGSDFALGALAAGADPVQAVEIACQFLPGCGLIQGEGPTVLRHRHKVGLC